MPERERPSLSGLSIKRPLPDRGKPVVSFDEAETALLGETPHATVPPVGPPEVHLTVPDKGHSTIQLPVLSPSLLKARRKEIKIAWTFEIPHELHQELSAVASHNGLTMSDIVIEAIQFHLPNFPHPPTR